jgi:ABC-type transporter Mla maintaining outer membrane lipid asymmetry permease subunit MlaE
LKTRGGATEVGRSTTTAVVLSIVMIYISDFFLANALFISGGSN